MAVSVLALTGFHCLQWKDNPSLDYEKSRKSWLANVSISKGGIGACLCHLRQTPADIPSTRSWQGKQGVKGVVSWGAEAQR